MILECVNGIYKTHTSNHEASIFLLKNHGDPAYYAQTATPITPRAQNGLR